MTAKRTYRIATIPGDGIGKEVIPAGQHVVDVAARRHGFSVAWDQFDWSCERYARTGRMMPEDGVAQVKGHDALYLGAVGFPGVPNRIGAECRRRFVLLEVIDDFLPEDHHQCRPHAHKHVRANSRRFAGNLALDPQNRS
jgi:hypothetical protein